MYDLSGMPISVANDRTNVLPIDRTRFTCCFMATPNLVYASHRIIHLGLRYLYRSCLHHDTHRIYRMVYLHSSPPPRVSLGS